MEDNMMIEVPEDSVLSLPPELWSIIVSFLDVRSLRLRSVNKLFNRGLKDIKNYDMIALGELLDKIEKRKAAYEINKLWHQDELQPRLDLVTLKAPKWRFLSEDEAHGKTYEVINVAALGDPKIGVTSLFRAITEQKGYQDANPASLGKRWFWEFKILVDDAYVVKFTMADNVETKYLATLKVVLFCFSLTDRASFESIRKNWYKIYLDYCDINVLPFFVGLRSDVPIEDRSVFAFRHPSVPNYVEVSAKDHSNVNKLINEIVKCTYAQHVKRLEKEAPKKEDSGCIVS